MEEEISDASTSSKVKSWISIVEEKAKKIYEILPKELLTLDSKESNARNPIFRFLKRENAIAGNLLKKLRLDLQKLIEMCKGTIKSTNDLRAIAIDIFNDVIPKQWRMYNTVDLTITEFIMDFRNRILQLNSAGQKSDYGKTLLTLGKRGLWLGGLIFPEAYLTATRQYVAQSLKVSLDELKLNVRIFFI